MKAVLTPAPLSGEIAAIPSKSQAHRMLICAALAKGNSQVLCQSAGQDMDATVRCLKALGAGIRLTETGYEVAPIGRPLENAMLDVGESGSTLRFLLPVVCALGVHATFLLHGRLAERPLEPLWSELKAHGATLSRGENRISVGGRLQGKDFCLRANVSSQFLSGILLALPLLGGGSLKMEGALESKGYLDMTIRSLAQFGIQIQEDQNTLHVPAGPLISPGDCPVEGDWSNAAFWLCAQTITVTGLEEDSPQGDRAVAAAIEAIKKGNAKIDCSQIPDLVPPLAVLAALTPGETHFVNAGRLRLKESDRITACVSLLRALGAEATEEAESFRVMGQHKLRGGLVDSFGDHRIAMAAAIAAPHCEQEIILQNPQAVEKSYAAFWQDYCCLGGKVRWEETT